MNQDLKEIFIVSMVMVSGGETLAERRLAQFFNENDALKYAKNAKETISKNEDARFFAIEIETFEVREFKNSNVQGMFDALNK
jgi:hypothetical protein